MSYVKNLIADKKGATAIEYGLIAALIAVAAITAMQGLGNQLTDTFGTTAAEMKEGTDKANN
ncbi:Flp family type IVb pilin [Sphingorhabdus sp. Alg239-R122]|uniref:Flp family type IVb pilin n=1 Tax=Sphingorhabdus sp. Alg239-R122 TaxID=2305989 RepID=UPI0013DB3AA2|nr:Flp family type IVb pilin [Sphingorhabdus sp. Alg239-R122]